MQLRFFRTKKGYALNNRQCFSFFVSAFVLEFFILLFITNKSISDKNLMMKKKESKSRYV